MSGEVANLKVEDLVQQVTVQLDQFGLLENQLTVDDKREQVADDEGAIIVERCRVDEVRQVQLMRDCDSRSRTFFGARGSMSLRNRCSRAVLRPSEKSATNMRRNHPHTAEIKMKLLISGSPSATNFEIRQLLHDAIRSVGRARRDTWGRL